MTGKPVDESYIQQLRNKDLPNDVYDSESQQFLRGEHASQDYYRQGLEESY